MAFSFKYYKVSLTDLAPNEKPQIAALERLAFFSLQYRT